MIVEIKSDLPPHMTLSPSISISPGAHEQANDPFKLVHSEPHPPLFVKHSLISAISHRYLSIIIMINSCST